VEGSAQARLPDSSGELRTTVARASKEEHDLKESSHVIDFGAPLSTTALLSHPLRT
jgi:hypothetical protein